MGAQKSNAVHVHSLYHAFYRDRTDLLDRADRQFCLAAAQVSRCISGQGDHGAEEKGRRAAEAQKRFAGQRVRH